MTDAQYNRLKESLLAGDRLAFRELLTDDDAANRANNDPEVMAYLETQEMSDYLTADEVEAVENLADFSNKLRSLAENIISDTLTIKTPKDLEMAKELLPLFNEISEMLISSIRGLQEQQPYITELINRPEYKDLTPRQFRYEEHTDENGNKYTFFDKFKKDLAELIEADRRNLPILQSKAADDLHKPTDKISNDLTQPIVRDKLLAKGQSRFLMTRTERGDAVPVTISMAIDEKKLAALGVKEYVTAWDITTIQALSTIYMNDTIARSSADKGKPVYCNPARLWRQMGGSSKLPDYTKKRLEKTLQKLATMWVELDASKLLNEYTQDGATGRKVPIKKKYKGTLIHVDIRQRGILDGKETDSIITIYADPVLMEFARDLDQVTTIPLYVVQATGTLNDDNLSIANYLQAQIAWLKKDPKRNRVINLKTLKEKTGTTKRDKALKDYIKGLLTEYATPPTDKKGNPTQAAWIEGFQEVATGYKIKISAPGGIEYKKSTKKVQKKETTKKKKPEK